MSHSRPIYDVHQDTSGKYTAKLVDESSVAIDSTVLESMTLTLYDSATEDIINSRDGQDVLNTNNATLDCEGNLVWSWTTADMPRLHETKPSEIHTALFTLVWNGGLNKMYHEVSFRVNAVNIP